MQKIKKPKFNHAMSLNFIVNGSQQEDWPECVAMEKELVVNALMEKINLILSDDEQFIQALDGFDTEEV